MRQILIEKYVKPSETKMEGTFFAECWFNEYGDLHSFLGHPAFIYYKNGVLTKQCWYKKGEKHRDNDFPAIIQYYKEKKDRQYWYKKGIMQREKDLPSEIWYDSLGIETYKYWRNIYGELHGNKKHPSIIYYIQGEEISKSWHKNGVFIKEENYLHETITYRKVYKTI